MVQVRTQVSYKHQVSTLHYALLKFICKKVGLLFNDIMLEYLGPPLIRGTALARPATQWRLDDDKRWLGKGSGCNFPYCISRNVTFVEITTCCVRGGKPRNVIIVGIQLYGISLKPVQLAQTAPMLGRWWSFTMRTQLYGNWEKTSQL